MVRRHYRCSMAGDEAEIATTIIALLNVLWVTRVTLIAQLGWITPQFLDLFFG